jgi:hypothetical protein
LFLEDFMKRFSTEVKVTGMLQCAAVCAVLLSIPAAAMAQARVLSLPNVQAAQANAASAASPSAQLEEPTDANAPTIGKLHPKRHAVLRAPAKPVTPPASRPQQAVVIRR